MAKKKTSRVVVNLEFRSTEGVYRYTTTKNRKNTPNRLELRKYCPITRKHEVFKEIK